MPKKIIYSATITALAILASVQLGFTAWPFTNDGSKPTLAPLLNETTPAVVNVSVISTVEGAQNPLFNDPFFRRFFDLPDRPEQRRRGIGSGVIVDAQEGLVLTNHHVIENATDIVVVLSDQRRLDAEIVGSDPGTDIALLRLESTNGLTELPFGDSNALQVGDFVLAIGNPFGLGQTATAGIVSALGRSGINIEGYENFIQIDASINPGNSGGALIDLQGNLIGINTAIISPAGGNIGIGFAVPSNMARDVMEQLLEFGEVRRGMLGVTIQSITPALAEALGLNVSEGAIVTNVLPDSSAQAAGIMPGDVITALNGEEVRGSSDLRNKVGLIRAGEEVNLTLVRDGESRTITAIIAAAPAEGSGRTEPEEDEGLLSGVAVATIPPNHPQYGQVEGVLVTSVRPGSNAALSNLRPQDIILAVNRQPVTSPAELSQRLQQAEGALALTVLRNEQRLFVVLQ